MPKPVKFAHVVYQTRRFDEMLAWYKDVFEAEPVHENPALAFLTYDDEHHRFAIVNLDVVSPGGSQTDRQGEIGVNHVAHTYATATDLLSTYRRLKARGIRPYWSVHHGPTLSLYYCDPDGNRMEFQVDALPAGHGRAYMSGAAMDANPIGVGYDPDALLARMEAGESEASLLAMPVGPIAEIPDSHGMI